MSRFATKSLRVGLVLLLSLWLAGAGCMFGCGDMGDMVASAANNPAAPESESHQLAAIVSGDACAANGSHDCCAKKKAEASQTSASNRTARPSLQTAVLVSRRTSLNSEPTGRMTECPLALSRAVAITKASDRNEAAPAVLPVTTATVVTSIKFQTPFLPVARLPNRGHTYLHCCVFLI